jgi:hypothetical protein
MPPLLELTELLVEPVAANGTHRLFLRKKGDLKAHPARDIFARLQFRLRLECRMRPYRHEGRLVVVFNVAVVALVSEVDVIQLSESSVNMLLTVRRL